MTDRPTPVLDRRADAIAALMVYRGKPLTIGEITRDTGLRQVDVQRMLSFTPGPRHSDRFKCLGRIGPRRRYLFVLANPESEQPAFSALLALVNDIEGACERHGVKLEPGEAEVMRRTLGDLLAEAVAQTIRKPRRKGKR